MTSESIIQKLDDMLRRGDFDTRAGLSFMGELVKDAFKYIQEQREAGEEVSGKIDSFETRIGHVEKGLYDFLEMRKNEQKKAEDERTFYRRAVIGGIISMLLAQLALFLSR